jgi:hypothetical protein
MLGTNIALPFLAMMTGALFGNWVGGQDGWLWGGAIGFGVGCAIVALIWVLFALLKRMVE